MQRRAKLRDGDLIAAAVRAKAGDIYALQEVIESNMGLVYSICHKTMAMFSKAGLPESLFDDMVQEGVLGIVRAVEKYDPSRVESSFVTYAYYWIQVKAAKVAKVAHAEKLKYDSLNEVREDDRYERQDSVVDTSKSPEENAQVDEVRRILLKEVHETCKKLNERALQVAKMRILTERYTLEETGKAIGVTRERVRQIEEVLKSRLEVRMRKYR